MAFEVVDRSKYQSLQRESSHRQCIRIRSKLLGLVEFDFNEKKMSSIFELISPLTSGILRIPTKYIET